ncbi:MAG: CoA transferase [Chloroflexi bacterium]|nr:CoA transferase [Chloroflexota bacterium]
MALPLDNVRVLDMSRVIAGPWCAMLLASLGAEVIHVEPPGGEDTRNMGPFAGPDRFSLYFAAHNSNKKSITLNTRSDNAKRLFAKLVEKSDVVIENFRPGVMKAMGFSWEEMAKINPGIILTSVTGFGQNGPFGQRGGFDQIMQAMYGMMDMTGEPDGEPMKAGTLVVDYLAGTNAAVATLGALRHRDRTGEGQHVDVALMDGSVNMYAFSIAEYLLTGLLRHRLGNQHYYSTPARVFKTKDGYVFIIIHGDNLWERLAKVIGGPALNENYKTRQGRYEHRPEVDGIVADFMATKTTDEAMKILEEGDVPAGPIHDLAQVAADPQVQYRHLLVDLEYPGTGRIVVPNAPFKLTRTPAEINRRPPTPGEHNEEIYGGLLGVSKEELEALKAEKAI